MKVSNNFTVSRVTASILYSVVCVLPAEPTIKIKAFIPCRASESNILIFLFVWNKPTVLSSLFSLKIHLDVEAKGFDIIGKETLSILISLQAVQNS